MALTPGVVHVDRPLSDLAFAAFESSEEWIGDLVMPTVEVDKRSDQYYTITQSDWIRAQDDVRAPGGRAKRIEWGLSTDTFLALNYALAEEYPLETVENADAALQFRENTAMHLVETLQRLKERRVATIVMSGGNVGSGQTLSGDTQFSSFSTSDPIGVFDTATEFMEDNFGLTPNTVVTTPKVIRVLRQHPKLLDMYKHVTGGMLSMEILAEVMGVGRILLGKGNIENAIEGASTSNITNIWDDNILFAHITGATGLRTKTLGLQFRWTNPRFGTPLAIMQSVNDEAGSEHTEISEAAYHSDEKITAAGLGYLIEDPISGGQ